MKKILIAEDDESILDAVTQVLESEGYEVEALLDGHQIISRMEKLLPDLLLMDISLSGVDGREVCLKLKQNKLVLHIPIVLMSANNSLKAIAKDACAEDFIAKPFQINDLLRKVEMNLI